MSAESWTAVASAAFVFMLVRAIWPPHRRLQDRVRPYSVGSRTALGGGADLQGVAPGAGVLPAMRRLLEPVGRRISARPLAWIRRSGDVDLLRRLAQAGWYPGVEESKRLVAYRMTQLKTLGLTAVVSLGVALLTPISNGRALAIVGLGLMVGGTRQRGRLERAIEDRRARMRIEIYTVNQLLAMRTRSGGGVIHAVSRLVERGSGEVVSELAEALRLHRNGMRSKDAFQRIAQNTPEPYCARTYALLAVAEDRGADLAGGLLALAEDVREARREAVKRNATKRRAAMLVPTIAILAPVMLLFVGAPLPRIVFGWQ